ncbi:hypothetical protein [Streptomyces cellulosae]|uniref:hypothetical protein n=1 Tax=Streptomyces cellulosae TaxID=1968 RepID=UPI0004C8A905|nr:hypothetical protein [Streptomyces cellulosae]
MGARRHIPRWRVLTWVILGFNLGMLLWLVIALDAARKGCLGSVGRLCGGATNPDSLLGAWLVILFWLAGVVILGIAWFTTHRTERSERRPHRGWHRRDLAGRGRGRHP